MRDLPVALAQAGWEVCIATPSYGALHEAEGADLVDRFNTMFRGTNVEIEAWRVPGRAGVDNVILHHASFAAQGRGRIYCEDPPGQPFATDASRFALFCAAAASWLLRLESRPDVVHLHDWHAGLYPVLLRYAPAFAALQNLRTVFTIHNLAYQGTRPLDGDPSSLAAWFPGLDADPETVGDPRYPGCVNPMAAAIRLADCISTVSPSYAREICQPSDPGRGFIGGEGLESLLQSAQGSGRLTGVLNGCEYTDLGGRRPGWQRLLGLIEAQLQDWQAGPGAHAAHELALHRIAALPKRRPRHVLTSIGRLVAQKASLLLQGDDAGQSPLERIAAELGHDVAIIILGSGEAAFERRMLEVAKRCPNVIFVRGYSETLADPLYHAGDLFLMPSSFEPCGISQMLAMRHGQPVVAHAVGGLRDTIQHDQTGFLFDGETPAQQADNFVTTTLHALAARTEDPVRWQRLCKAAAAMRFDWARAASETIDKLYAY